MTLPDSLPFLRPAKTDSQATPDVERLLELVRLAKIGFSIYVDKEKLPALSCPSPFISFQSETFSSYYICGIPTLICIGRNGRFMGEVDIAYAKHIAMKNAAK